MTKISFIVPFRIYYYTFEPIIKFFLSRQAIVSLYLPEDSKDLIYDLDSKDNLKVFSYEELISKYKIRKLIHTALMILLTPISYSNNYKILKLRNFRNPQYKGITKHLYRFLFIISFVSPKSKKINQTVNSIMRIIFKNKVFKDRKVVVGSLNPYSHLLSSKDLEVYSIMESWDHVVKQPSGYLSKAAFVWNEDLANDWKKYNLDKNVYGVFPLKLRFSKEVERKKVIKNKICCYAAAYSDHFTRSKISDVEHLIIRKIAAACQRANWKLLIKLRPNGRPDEFDYLKTDFKNITISLTESLNENPANYYLTKDYNMERFNFIEKADFIINCFTTFGLDAAFAKIPVLQMDVRGDESLKNSSLFYNNHHINKYLLQSNNILRIPPSGSLENTFFEYLMSEKNIHYNYTEELSNWIGNGISPLDEACNFIYKKITDE